ncbi:OmpA family protein [Ancrocorticia sp.]
MRKCVPAAIAAVLLLAGCSESGQSSEATASAPPPATSPTPEPTATEAAQVEAQGPVVPGYAYGEMPPVPLFTLPDLGLLSDSMDGFTLELKELVGDYPGLTISPARCDEAGTVSANQGSVLLYGDGSATYTGADGSSINFGDGSGVYTINGVQVVNFGDGSGNYSDGDVSIVNFGDGSGNYNDAEKSVVVAGDGSGNYTDGEEEIINHGDGSGNYTKGDVSIINHGDGSGNYDDADISIINNGDGTGLVDGEPADMEPIDPVPTLGKFPPMDALAPVESCGTTITLDSGVLFDPDEYVIRPDAAATLDSVAEALSDADVESAVVEGHTDSVRDTDWNQTLSENRADAVAKALEDRGVTGSLETVGYGETRPVAPNDTDAGRQENRRVEIFIPAF